MCRLGSAADLKGGYLSCTLVFLNILIKDKLELQKIV